MKIAYSKTSVRFVHASAMKHWTWKLAQSGDKKLTVTFSHGSDTYTFVASIGKHGKLVAQVDHPVTKVTSVLRRRLVDLGLGPGGAGSRTRRASWRGRGRIIRTGRSR